MSCSPNELCSLADAIDFGTMADVVIPAGVALVALFVILRAVKIVNGFVRGGEAGGGAPDERDDGADAYWDYLDAHDPYAGLTEDDFKDRPNL